MKNYNLYKVILFFMVLLCAVSCSDMKTVTFYDEKLNNSLDISKIILSTKDLEPVFQIIIGDKWHNYYDNQNDLIYLSDFADDNPCPESVWLVSPFYEPKQFFLRDFDTTEPIELSTLARTMIFKPIEANKTPTGWQFDPFVSFKYEDNDWNHLYNWSSEQTLQFYSLPRGVGLVGLDTEDSIPSSLLHYLNDQSFAVSPDNKRAAYIDKGYVVIRDFVTQEQNKWELTQNPDSQSFHTFSTEFLTWSPNGRYLVGSNYAYFDHYLTKVWVLDIQTRIIRHFNTLYNHAFVDPIWSPDSNQVVVSEYFRPYSEDFFGQWILLDLPTLKITSLARRDSYETNYDFSWDNGKLQLSAKSSDHTTTYAFDSALSITQDKYDFVSLLHLQEGEEIVPWLKLSPDKRYIGVLKTKPYTQNLVTVSLELIDLQLIDKI
ncbi:MAG: hypothetical protein APF84_19635 [Gracilibacter sp. BRH_c7a]|nr:MAG: hypothetical protein APF84_19635 [Gracilibacter sp. BRH_c7a]